MTSKRITLELSAFLDSSQAQSLAGIAPAARRTIAERFLAASHEDLGRPPAELDGDQLFELLSVVLPSRFDPKDELARSVPAVVEAFLAHLSEQAVVIHAFEQRLALERGLEAFAEALARREGPRRRSQRESRPVEYGAERTGRNDPCPCGSGLKFKRCHGKQA
jgi:hypothetical protein